MTTTADTTGRARVWAPLGVPSFRMLWLGQSLSLLGDGFSYIAFAWITLSLTGSTVALGVVLAFQAVPRALLTLVGGSLSDRWSTRLLMMLSSWARALLMVAVGVAGFAGVLSVPALCVAAAAFGAVDAFFQPARVSILPSVVEGDLLPPANALLSVGTRVSAVVGPAVGGIVVAFSDANVAFLVDGLCFALCGLCVSRIRTRARPGPATREPAEPMRTRIRDGLRYAFADPRIRTVIVVDTAVTFCYAGPFTVGFATLAGTRLDGGAAALGLLGGALAGGAMLGALVGGVVGGRPRVGLLIAGLAVWLAVGMLVLGVVESTVVAVATVLAMGFAMGFQGVFGLSWIQSNIEASVLSRVISVDMVVGYAVAPISLVVCGVLAQSHLGLLFVGAALVLLLTALGVLASGPVRAMR